MSAPIEAAPRSADMTGNRRFATKSKSQSKNEDRKKAKAKAIKATTEKDDKCLAVAFLQAKLAFAFARLCSSNVYNEMRAERPIAADDDWSPHMSSPLKHVSEAKFLTST